MPPVAIAHLDASIRLKVLLSFVCFVAQLRKAIVASGASRLTTSH